MIFICFIPCLQTILSWQESESLKREFLGFEDLGMMSIFPSIAVESRKKKKKKGNLLVTMEKLGILAAIYSLCNGIHLLWVLVSRIQVSKQNHISPLLSTAVTQLLGG